MMLGLLLSAAISNVTAPVLLLAVVQPLLQEPPSPLADLAGFG